MNRMLEELMLIALKDVGVKAVDMANFYNGLIANVKPGDLPDAKTAGLMRTDRHERWAKTSVGATLPPGGGLRDRQGRSGENLGEPRG
jgi:hypothetical protein